MGGLGPKAWACLPGQGLRYLEHLCLVLEQMARLQQLYLQLQTQRPPGASELQVGQVSGGSRGGLGALQAGLPSEQAQPSSQVLSTRLSCAQDPEAVEGEWGEQQQRPPPPARDPSPPPSCAPGSEVQELLSQTQETGEVPLCFPVCLANPGPPTPGGPPQSWF